MEIIQVTPKEVRITLWVMALILFVSILLIRAPAYISAFAELLK